MALTGAGVEKDAGSLLVLEPVALTADVDRVVQEAVEDGGRGDLVAEDRAPLDVAAGYWAE